MTLRVLIRGGGDLASGVALRCWRAGWEVLITELDQPRAVRRLVSFAQAVYVGTVSVEEVTAVRIDHFDQVIPLLSKRVIPVVINPDASIRFLFSPNVIVDGRMLKRPSDLSLQSADLVIGLGPGFEAGKDCHGIVETNRGPFLGRVIWRGTAEKDTGIPETVAGQQSERVLRAPRDGVLTLRANIGQYLKCGDPVAAINGELVTAGFDGIIRGLMMSGLSVIRGEKIGDIDPRADPRLCVMVSDKALAIGGGVIEAILSTPILRSHLYS